VKNKALLFTLLGLAFIAQWYIPLSMSQLNEEVLEKGVEYRFRTAPVDPADLFRGRYVALRFDAASFSMDSSYNWSFNKPAYATLAEDSLGFAMVIDLSIEAPTDDIHYVEVQIQSRMESPLGQSLQLKFPFDRFYMEETKAKPAELAYAEAARDSSKEAYALVKVHKGEAALVDVMIDGVSLQELVESQEDQGH
jgi:uncharacterized membrane-anchored protein